MDLAEGSGAPRRNSEGEELRPERGGRVGTAGVSTADSARSPTERSAHPTRGSRSPTDTPSTALSRHPLHSRQQGGSLMSSCMGRTRFLTNAHLLQEGTTILPGCLKLIAYFSPLLQSCQGQPVLLPAMGTASQHHRSAGRPASSEPFHCWREFCPEQLAQHPGCNQTGNAQPCNSLC